MEIKTFRELITNEMIDRIKNKLNQETKLMEEKEIGSTIYDDYSEIEILVIADISNDYFQIPLIELEETINKINPFVSEFGITIVPYVECDYSDSSQIARAFVTHFYTTSNLYSLTDNQYEDFKQLLDELVEVYDEMRIGIKVEFESVESDQQDEELLRVIEIYEGW